MSKAQTPTPATEEKSLSEQAAASAPVGFTGYAVKKLLTLPVLTFVVGVTRGVRIDEPMYIGKEIKKDGAQGDKPATLANCTNLEDGTPCMIVVPAVVQGNFDEHYPDAAYVGKSFAIEKRAKRDGKRYFDYMIAEVEGA